MKVKDSHVYDVYANTYGYLYIFECEGNKNSFYFMSTAFTKKQIKLGKMQLYTYFKNKNQLSCVIYNNKNSFDKVALSSINDVCSSSTKPSLFKKLLKKLQNSLKRE